MATVQRLTCPACGFNVSMGDSECPAGHPIHITNFSSVYDMPAPMVNKYANTYRKDLAGDPDNKELNHSLGICFLKLKIYDKALLAFEKAMEDNFDNSESFFYAAVCVLKGRKAFLCMRPEIDKIEEYINAAIMIEPRGIYYYLLAYIKYDYFARKCFRTSPTYQEALRSASEYGYSPTDVKQLFDLLGVEKPSCL